MPEHPLKVFEKTDPDLLKLVMDTGSFALKEGTLPRRFKLLIAMALDAAHGTVDGTRSLAQQAMQAGATKEEVMETIRVAHYIAGAGAVYTAARAFAEIF